MITKYFKIEELVSPDILNKLPDKNMAWRFLNERALYTLDKIRTRYNKPVTINNYHLGGKFKERGLRAFDNITGAKWSDHKFGNAFDFDVLNMSAEEVRQDILNNKDSDDFKYITIIEEAVNWVHTGFSNIIVPRIMIVYPK